MAFLVSKRQLTYCESNIKTIHELLCHFKSKNGIIPFLNVNIYAVRVKNKKSRQIRHLFCIVHCVKISCARKLKKNPSKPSSILYSTMCKNSKLDENN